MKSGKMTGSIFYVCAVLFYIAALLNIFNSETRSMWAVWLCLGSCFLCLGSARMNKAEDKDDDEKNSGEK